MRRKPRHLTDATIRNLNAACYGLREDGVKTCMESCVGWCEEAWRIVLGESDGR